MRVLLVNQVFHPDVAATAQHAHDLARHLVRHGHEVNVVASRSIYGQRGGTLPKREDVDGATVYRVGRSLFGKVGLAGRLVDFLLFYVAAATRALTLPKADVVVCFTTPPFIALLGWLLKRLRGSRFVYWVMDLYPEVPVGCGVMREGSLLTRLFEGLNRFCLRRADRVVVLGRCMQARVLAKNVDADRVKHIGVWADPGEVQPVDRATNPLRREWGLDDAFVVMYSGNLGLAHDAATMCNAAKALDGDERIRFLFVGAGKRMVEAEDFVKAHGLTNCRFEPYQPRERLAESLSCGDLHLVSLLEGLEGVIVPCKLFGIMAAERPTAYIGHPDSEIARVLVEHACGRLVRQGDVDDLVETIRSLAADGATAARMGVNARTALRDAYDRDRACEAWRQLLEELAAGAPRPQSQPEPQR